MKNFSRSRLLAVVLLAMLVTYANSFHNGFHFDDFHTVTDNPSVRSLTNVPRFFTDATTFSVLPANRTYRPVVSTSLAIEYALGHGYQPLWFHVGTFVLFLGLVALLFGLYKLVLDKTRASSANAWIAVLGAAWFGLHPAMAETVNYVIQRGDLYCTLGCVGALWVFARWPGLRRWGLYLLPLLFALLSKPPAAVFPVLLLLYVYFFEADGAGRWRRSALAVWPSALLVAACLVLQSAMTPRTFLPSTLSPWDYRLTQPFVWLRYFGALVLPMHLNVDTDLAVFNSVNAEMVAGLVFVAALAAAIGWCARRRMLYPVAFGLLWFVVTQLPTSLYPLSEVENDHRMFFSFAGLMLAVVWAAALTVMRWTSAEQRVRLRPVLLTIALLLLCGYGYGTRQRNKVWKTEETLWLDDVQKSPANGRGLMIYGLTQMNKGNYAAALAYFNRALVYTPNYPTLEINLGIDSGAMGRAAEAERHFLRALALAPNDDVAPSFYGRFLMQQGRTIEAAAQLRRAVALNPSRMAQREDLMTALSQTGDAAGATAAAEEALRIDPRNAVALATKEHPLRMDAPFWINMSLQQYRQRLFTDSIVSAQKALATDPRAAAAMNNIGADYAGLGQYAAAVAWEEKAVAADPALQIARNNLAAYKTSMAGSAGSTVGTPFASSPETLLQQSLVLNQAGQYEASIAAARKALVARPNFAEAWNNIAAGYAAEKKWDRAIDAAQRAMALKPDFQLAKNNLAWAESEKAARQ